TPHTHADEPRPDPAEAHARHAEPTPAGVSHHGGDPDMGDLPHRVPNDPRFFTADVHITPDGRARIGGHDYTPAEYADMLRRSGYDGSKPVRLIGCDAASNDFAQQLSRHLDAPVVAPTKPAWTDANGRVFTSDVDITPDGTRQPKIPPNGEWETHHPDGSKTKASDDGYAPGSDKNTDGADAKDRGEDTGSKGDEEPEERPKPLSAGDERVDDPPHFPDAEDPGRAPDTRDPEFERDKSRGAIVEQIDPTDTSRVTTKNGLIETIDGKPVKEYVQDLSKSRAVSQHAPNMESGDGPCSAVAIDRKTGLITEGVNGQADDLIEPENLHPLLRDNYMDMAEWKHPIMRSETDAAQMPVLGENGKALKDAEGKVITKDAVLDGRAHFDDPMRHAEVKAVNELLWERQRAFEDAWRKQHGADSVPPPLSREVLDEMRFDPRWTDEVVKKGNVVRELGGEAPACGNCNSILRDVPSYSGRYHFPPGDHRRNATLEPPVTE
ncbi:hypothetical protein FKR81_39840, partial [Lentzea tibetensis]